MHRHRNVYGWSSYSTNNRGRNVYTTEFQTKSKSLRNCNAGGSGEGIIIIFRLTQQKVVRLVLAPPYKKRCNFSESYITDGAVWCQTKNGSPIRDYKYQLPILGILVVMELLFIKLHCTVVENDEDGTRMQAKMLRP